MYAKRMIFLGLVVLIAGLVLFGCSGTPQTEQYKVTVAVEGQGTVTKTPEQATYDANSSVKLEAKPGSGWSFKNWSGSIEGTENPVTVVMDSDQTITAVFASENVPPVLAPIGNKSVQEGETLTFTVTASDPNGGTVTLSATNVPTGATFTAATGVFSWTPAASQVGNYSVTFKASDGKLHDSEEITISVGDVNQPPVLASIGNKTVNEAETLTFKVTASDPDGDVLTYSVIDAPDGVAFDTATGDFSWTPTDEQSDIYPVTFRVSDGTDVDSETITIEVVDVPLPEKIVFAAIYNPNSPTIYTEDIFYISTDGTNVVNLTNTLWDNERSPDCSADGSKIVYTRERNGKGDIFVMNADGSDQVNLTNSTYDDYSPVWSPDGTKIAFVSLRESGYPQIYVMNADGSNQVNLTNNSVYNIDPDWSPDGSKIVFASSLEGGFDIFVMNADGTNPVNISNTDVQPTNPAWSPDGTKIAYVGDGTGDHLQDVYTMNADGSNQVNLTADSWANFSDSPAWSPDSTRIVFDAQYHIYIMNADGSNKTNITNVLGDGASCWEPGWMSTN